MKNIAPSMRSPRHFGQRPGREKRLLSLKTKPQDMQAQGWTINFILSAFTEFRMCSRWPMTSFSGMPAARDISRRVISCCMSIPMIFLRIVIADRCFGACDSSRAARVRIAARRLIHCRGSGGICKPCAPRRPRHRPSSVHSIVRSSLKPHGLTSAESRKGSGAEARARSSH